MQVQIDHLESDNQLLEQEKTALRDTFTAEQAKLDDILNQLQAFAEKDAQIAQKDEELRTLQEQTMNFFQDKESFMQDKEAFLNEKEQLSNAKITLENKVAELEKDINETRRKIRESGDGLLGSSMEIEALKDKLKEKEDYVAEIEAKVKGLTTGGTGVIGDFGDLIRLMKEKFSKCKRNVRILVPELTDFERHGFLDLLDKLPPQATVYIAAGFDPSAVEDLISELRQRKVKITNYQERNEYALNVDGAECILAIISKEEPDTVLGGIFTNIDALITLFKDAIMQAWTKGVKYEGMG